MVKKAQCHCTTKISEKQLLKKILINCFFWQTTELTEVKSHISVSAHFVLNWKRSRTEEIKIKQKVEIYRQNTQAT